MAVASTSQMAMAAPLSCPTLPPTKKKKKVPAQVIKSEVKKEKIEVQLPPAFPMSSALAKGKNSQKKDKQPAKKKVSVPAPSETSIISVTRQNPKCPWNGCKVISKSSLELQKHYRSHTKVKPFECTVSFCRKTSRHLWGIYQHICVVHLNQFNEKEAKKYVKVQKEILIEEAKQLGIDECFAEDMYEEAKSIAGHFSKMEKTIIENGHTRKGMKHTKVKSFTCLFPNCTLKVEFAEKLEIIRHINCVHFKFELEEYNYLSKKQKQKAEQYIKTTNVLLVKEENQIGKAQKRKNEIFDLTTHADSDFKSPHIKKARYEVITIDDSSDEEDDKDKLASLLATVQPSTSK